LYPYANHSDQQAQAPFESDITQGEAPEQQLASELQFTPDPACLTLSMSAPNVSSWGRKSQRDMDRLMRLHGQEEVAAHARTWKSSPRQRGRPISPTTSEKWTEEKEIFKKLKATETKPWLAFFIERNGRPPTDREEFDLFVDRKKKYFKRAPKSGPPAR
jgi:hypothetical protein